MTSKGRVLDLIEAKYTFFENTKLDILDQKLRNIREKVFKVRLRRPFSMRMGC